MGQIYLLLIMLITQSVRFSSSAGSGCRERIKLAPAKAGGEGEFGDLRFEKTR